MTGARPRRLVLGLAFFAVLMLGLCMLMLHSWSDVRAVDAATSEQAFAAVLAALGDEPALLQVAPDGAVSVRRELLSAAPVELNTLHLLTTEAGGGQLLEVGFPFWFVRMKMNDSINLGTFTTFFSGDWSQLTLKVTEEDLARRGPGLILDHRKARGGRLLLWTD